MHPLRPVMYSVLAVHAAPWKLKCQTIRIMTKRGAAAEKTQANTLRWQQKPGHYMYVYTRRKTSTCERWYNYHTFLFCWFAAGFDCIVRHFFHSFVCGWNCPPNRFRRKLCEKKPFFKNTNDGMAIMYFRFRRMTETLVMKTQTCHFLPSNSSFK